MHKTEQYYELNKEIVDFYREVESEFAFAMNIKYIFQANNKQKSLIKISKLADNYAVLLNADLLITVNDTYFDKFDDEIRTILFEQEIDKIHPNLDKGTIKLVQPNLKTSVGIVKRHTYTSVERANEAERLLVEQKGDQQNEE
jgi:predicted transcriptional regulator